MSVIVPTHDRRELVVRAVGSVLRQTVPPAEVIVVDDGSTDGTPEMLHERFGDRVQCIRRPRGGVSAARNTGIRAARGDLVALLDSDDEWKPHKLERQLAHLARHPDLDMVLCDYTWKGTDHAELETVRRRAALPHDGELLEWVLATPALAPSTALLRRQVCLDLGGFDETLKTAEDHDFHIRLAAGHRIGLVEEPLVWLMRGDAGLSSLASSYEDHLRVLKKSTDALAARVPEAMRNRALGRAYVRAARGQVLIGQWREAVRLGHQAWRLAPEPGVQRSLLALMPLAVRRILTSRRHRWQV